MLRMAVMFRQAKWILCNDNNVSVLNDVDADFLKKDLIFVLKRV